MKNVLTDSRVKLTLIFFISAISLPSMSYESAKTKYTIKVNDRQTHYDRMSFFFLPKEKVNISIYDGSTPVPFSVSNANTSKVSTYTSVIADKGSRQEVFLYPNGLDKKITVILFSMVPYTDIKNGKLGSYTIGQYPETRLNNLAIYDPPLGFVKVEKDSTDFLVSPHYKLGQFLCKQSEGFPKYIVLQTRLLRKLEFLTDAVNESGISTKGFTIMSGYRTPYYNSLIKNKKYSRHQWGGAADIYIDESPKNNVMDDLNKDGKVNLDDAKMLSRLIESFYAKHIYKPFVGGLGLYSANAAHGPFVHVDVRGTRARW